MNEYQYLYGFTWAGCSRQRFGPGVDQRFAVELVRWRHIAALTSLVGQDQFDPDQLEQGTADTDWMLQVAVRHNQVIQEVIRQSPVLPLRMGAIFRSRASLTHKLMQCETTVVDFLRRLGGRQEWSVKVFLDRERAEEQFAASAGQTPWPARSSGSTGVEYLTARRTQRDRGQQVNAAVVQDLQDLENTLPSVAESWCRLRLLPASLAGRPEKMVWNAAFLIPSTLRSAFHAECERRKHEFGPKGLILEVNGPWPVYNFCPKIDL